MFHRIRHRRTPVSVKIQRRFTKCHSVKNVQICGAWTVGFVGWVWRHSQCTRCQVYDTCLRNKPISLSVSILSLKQDVSHKNSARISYISRPSYTSNVPTACLTLLLQIHFFWTFRTDSERLSVCLSVCPSFRLRSPSQCGVPHVSLTSKSSTSNHCLANSKIFVAILRPRHLSDAVILSP